jgi:diguanylate cyclase (GGDEF)-like protein
MLHATIPATRAFLARALILALGLCVLAGPSLCAAEPATLTSIQAIRALSQDEARVGIPVAFEATVTYYNPGDVDLFVQDNGQAIYVEFEPGHGLLPGDRVLVRGRTRASFTTDVTDATATLVRHGSLPKPVEADFGQLIRAERDCMLVTIKATVRSADRMSVGNRRYLYLRLLMRGGYVDASVVGTDPALRKQLLNAEVEITGAVSGQFDSKMQLVGVLLEVPSTAQVKIVKRAETNVDSLPLTPMDKILSAYSVIDLTKRVRVEGTITYSQPGVAAVLQNGSSSLWISTRSSKLVQIGDFAVATGYPDERSGFLALNDGEIEDTHVAKPVEPQAAVWHDLADWSSGDAKGHQNDLVSIEGTVVASVREESQDEFDLQTDDGKLFNAIYRHPESNLLLARFQPIPEGTRVRVTGICTLVQGNSADPSISQVPFNILLRSFDDIAVVGRPSPVNVANLILLVGVLLILLLSAGVWGWVAERKVRYQNAEAAYSERRRGRILEDINGTRPLAEILEQITELASFKLHGAPCWCQIADGARLGRYPEEPSAFRVISENIPSRSGPPLGTVYAAFDRLTKTRDNEKETLSMAVAVAALAIETRRLYSDLVHRSEFDLLTDIHNRFSLESYLDEQIEEARRNASVFGLVYVDLDHFKQVNDRHGHLAGDLYLREVAARMKRQLRPHDMLARLGGDEFAVLLPQVRNRGELEEIAHRLRTCLAEPFAGDGYVIHGSASIGIALYPEDGTTQDSLLSSADAAMYVNKYSSR